MVYLGELNFLQKLISCDFLTNDWQFVFVVICLLIRKGIYSKVSFLSSRVEPESSRAGLDAMKYLSQLKLIWISVTKRFKLVTEGFTIW